MIYKCGECGRTFDEPETWREIRGEFWGVMAYETMTGCPNCYSGDFDEYKEGENEDEC